MVYIKVTLYGIDMVSGFNRRSVVKSIGASAVGTTFGVTAGSAQERVDMDLEGCKAETAYESASEVEEMINDYTGFLNTLSQLGFLEEAGIEIEDLLSDTEYLRSENGARSWGLHYYGGYATPHITVRRKIAVGRLVIAYNPDMDNGIRAMIKPQALIDADHSETGHEVTLIRSEGTGSTPQIEVKQYAANDPEELSSNGGPSTMGMVIQGCKQYGGFGCDSEDCQSWEGECLGSDDCAWYECTGTTCCGGCCCCEDQARCCEVCNYECPESPCDLHDSKCYNGGCCDCC